MKTLLDNPRVKVLLESFLADDPENATVVLDADGHIVAWLGAAKRLFGYSAEEIVGRHVEDLFTAQDRAKRQAHTELHAARVAGRAEDDRWHLRQDGAAIWVTGSVTALNDGDGDLLGFVKMMRDRTDLRTHIETLETRLAGLTERLDAAKFMLQTVGHELRNPLQPMKHVAALLERASSDGAPSLPVSILNRQIAVMQRLADDLMDFSQIESGRLELRLQVFELRQFLRQIVDSQTLIAASRGIAVELVLPDAPITLTADAERLQQVVVNLLDNALRHNTAGHRVVVRAVEEPPHAVIRVEDNGAGIAPELLPRLFELFTSGTTTPAGQKGLGIGLALAKELVELHGGSIEARSAGVDKGAVFAVRVPTRH
jgi:PAS domain S-box-containing protein